MRPATLVMLVVLAGSVRAEDWPTYQHDASRTGITSQRIAPPLVPCWVFQALALSAALRMSLMFPTASVMTL